MSENTYLSPAAIRSAENLGIIVAQTRKARGYSQQEFGDIAGVGRRFISELENGKETAQLGKILQVLTALGLDLLVKAR